MSIGYVCASSPVPTVMCSPLAAGPGNVNVSWVIEYDGGRPVTAIEIAYNQVGGNYQAIRTVSSPRPSMTSAIIIDQFIAGLTYAFMVSASNIVGNSTLITCGQVTITEGNMQYVSIRSLLTNICYISRDTSCTQITHHFYHWTNLGCIDIKYNSYRCRSYWIIYDLCGIS